MIYIGFIYRYENYMLIGVNIHKIIKLKNQFSMKLKLINIYNFNKTHDTHTCEHTHTHVSIHTWWWFNFFAWISLNIFNNIINHWFIIFFVLSFNIFDLIINMKNISLCLHCKIFFKLVDQIKNKFHNTVVKF